MILSLIAPAILSAASPQMAAKPPISDIDEPFPIPAELEEVVADRDRYERMTVPVTIAGQGPYRFLVDTGAQATVVTQRVVDDLALRPDGKAMLVAMGSRAVVDMIPLEGLEFANRRFNNIRAPLLVSRHVGADGILGLDSLQDLRVLMDFEGDRITVADASELGGSDGFEIVVRARRQLGQMIITDAKIDQVRVNVVIDTGAQGSFGNAALAKRLSGKQLGIETATDVNGAEMANEMRLARSLTIGGITLSGLSVGFTESPIFEALGLHEAPALVLGIGDLRAFRRVAIDFDDRRVLFDLPRDVAAQMLRQRFTFTTQRGTRID